MSRSRAAARAASCLLVGLSLGAGLLAAEAWLDLAPRSLPAPLQLFLARQRLAPSLMMPDPALGLALESPRRARYRWGGREVLVEQRPFGEDSGPGRRVDPASPAGRPDILVLGDSFAYAFESDWRDSWCGRLERLGGWKVENLGVPGYGTAQEALLLRRYGLALQPRLVLLLVVANDPRDDVLFDGWKRAQLDPDSSWRDYGQYLFCAGSGLGDGSECRAFYSLSAAGSLSSLFRLALYAWQSRRAAAAVPFFSDAGVESVERGVDEIARLSRGAGAPLVVVFARAWQRDPGAAGYDRLKAFVRARRIPVLDLADGPETRSVPLDGHWTAQAQALVAGEIHRFLADRGWPRRPGSGR